MYIWHIILKQSFQTVCDYKEIIFIFDFVTLNKTLLRVEFEGSFIYSLSSHTANFSII